MVGASLHKDKLFHLFISILVSILFYPLVGHSAVFNVTNAEELRVALSIAATNGEDDMINLASGLYRTHGIPFIYITVENFSLSIIGQGPELTKFIPDVNPSQILVIRTPNQGVKSQGNISVKGVSIEGGFTPIHSQPGGGLFIGEFGIVTIENCNFRSNSAIVGGGISVRADSIYLRQNEFNGNSAQVSNGGAYLGATDITVEYNTFENNSSAGGSGGGLGAGGINVTINNNIFNGNLALSDENGGGVAIGADKNLILTNNLFTNNFAGSFGGGADIFAHTAEIVDNVFNDNTAGSVGGGFAIRADNVSISSNIVANNETLSSSETGGGGTSVFIPANNPSITNQAEITNNIFMGNYTGGNGGGVYVDTTTQVMVLEEILTITNNTLVLNSTNKDGGGIHIYDTSDHGNFFGIYNNIAYSNMADGNGNDISIADGVFSNIGLNLNLFNNDFTDFYSNCENKPGCQPNINRANNIDQDPLFVDAEAGDVSLQPDSPCIDAGDPDAPHVPNTDIFGNPRVPPPDMGAVEFIELVVDGEAGGGCSIAHAPLSSLLAVILAIPALIVVRRFVKVNKIKQE